MLVQSAFFHHLLSIEVTPPGVESFGAVVGKFEREEVYFQTPDFEGSQFLLEGGAIFPVGDRGDHRSLRQKEGAWEELSKSKFPCDHIRLVGNKGIALFSWRQPNRENG